MCVAASTYIQCLCDMCHTQVYACVICAKSQVYDRFYVTMNPKLVQETDITRNFIVITDASFCLSSKKYLLFLSFLQCVILLFYLNFSGHIMVQFPVTSVEGFHSVQNVIKAEQTINNSHPDIEQDLKVAFPDSRMGAESPPGMISVVVGLGITSRFRRGFLKQSADMVFFQTLMPSFCMTASVGFSYRFYLAYDFDDPFFAKRDNLVSFNAMFEKFRMKECDRLTFMSLHFVKCSHVKHPAWAQNDAMMMAYMDGNDYYYRINDDTKMATNGWTEKFIKRLSEYDPPNIGVVGPTHSGGKYRHTHIRLCAQFSYRCIRCLLSQRIY